MRKGILLLLTLVLGLYFGAGSASASVVSAVQGYAWSSNVGWISFNCKNSNYCGTVNYGVDLDRGTNTLSGYAWNSNVGWISFNSSDVAGCPTAPCAPTIVNGNLQGWAKVISGSSVQGWDGWIHLKGSNYGVSFDGTKFTGYSWSDQVIGWMEWNPSLGPGVFSEADYNVTTGISGGGSQSQVQVESDICTNPTCVFPYPQGQGVSLVATAGVGYKFSHWTGPNASDCGDINSRFCSLSLSANKELYALFAVANCPTDGPGNCPVCNDGVDNDNDGKIDYPADPECVSRSGTSETTIQGPACDNCLDDDGDGQIDWVHDTGCNGDPSDNNETNAILTVSRVEVGNGVRGFVGSPDGINCGTTCTKEYRSDEHVTLTAIGQNPQTIFDYWSGSCNGLNSSCTLVMSQSRNAVAHFRKAGTTGQCPSPDPALHCPQCNDTLDNNGDGKIDYPADPGCSDINDNNEDSTPNCPSAGPGVCPECNDGVDNDGDGQIDYPNDRQCTDPNDNNESDTGANCPADGHDANGRPTGLCPVCNDGVDNDNDGKIDYPADPGCYSRSDNNERDPVPPANCPAAGPGVCPQCDDGIDNDHDGKADWRGLDTDHNGTIDIPPDPSCQGDPNKNTEAGGLDVIEI